MPVPSPLSTILAPEGRLEVVKEGATPSGSVAEILKLRLTPSISLRPILRVLRLSIPIESTGGAVTAVPVSALSLAADGTSRVQVDNNGTLEFIVVEPGLSADGFVEVTPVDGTLAPGQLVVVGYEKKY